MMSWGTGGLRTALSRRVVKLVDFPSCLNKQLKAPAEGWATPLHHSGKRAEGPRW